MNSQDKGKTLRRMLRVYVLLPSTAMMNIVSASPCVDLRLNYEEIDKAECCHKVQ